MIEYPAAHSMDSTWFAVDSDGNVAMFDTGEGGCIPTDDFPFGGEAGGGDGLEREELLAYALRSRAKTDERLRALLPATLGELIEAIENALDWELTDAVLNYVGVWTYSCDEPFAAPYARSGLARDPLTLPDLAPELAKQFEKAALPIRFDNAEAIAPGKFGPVHAWGSVWIDLEGKIHPTEDGRTLRRSAMRTRDSKTPSGTPKQSPTMNSNRSSSTSS